MRKICGKFKKKLLETCMRNAKLGCNKICENYKFETSLNFGKNSNFKEKYILIELVENLRKCWGSNEKLEKFLEKIQAYFEKIGANFLRKL